MTVTLITGANKGLGYETARRLIAEGHTVYMGAHDADRGEAAASTLGGRFVQLDVTDDASVESALRSIDEREGLLDVVVNNAGVSWTGDIGGPARYGCSTRTRSASSVSPRLRFRCWKSPRTRWS